MKGNLDQHAYLKKIASYYGANFKPGIMIYPKTDGSKEPCMYRVTEEKHFARYLHKWFPDDTEGDVHKKEEKTIEPDTIKSKRICNAGRTICSIAPNGDVLSCVMLPWKLGNLKEKSFKAIWHTEANKELRMLRSLRISDLTKCSQCDIYGFCTPCIGLNYLETSDIFQCSAEYCRMAYWLFSRQSHPKGGINCEATIF